MRRSFALACFALAAAGCTVTGATVCQPTGPSPRAFATAILDSTTNEVYLYGGENAKGPIDELWRYTFTGCVGWLQLTPTTETPGGLSHYAAAFDASRNRIVYVGGAPTAVWSLDIDTMKWTKVLAAGTAPPLATNSWAVYDTNDNNDRIIVGGVGVKPFDFSDATDGTWSDYLSGAQWTAPVSGVGGLDPTRRTVFDWNGNTMGTWSIDRQMGGQTTLMGDAPMGSVQAMAWDPQQGRLVAFASDGAYGIEDVDALGTVATVHHLATTGAPPPRSGAGFTISGDLGFLFGGADAHGCYLNDWWYLTDETSWTQRGVATACP